MIVHYQVAVVEAERMRLWIDFEDNTKIPDTDYWLSKMWRAQKKQVEGRWCYQVRAQGLRVVWGESNVQFHMLSFRYSVEI